MNMLVLHPKTKLMPLISQSVHLRGFWLYLETERDWALLACSDCMHNVKVQLVVSLRERPMVDFHRAPRDGVTVHVLPFS